MTCVLEYTAPETVLVHDLIYTRQNGVWTLSTSSYPKLRLSPDWLTNELTKAGLTIHSQGTAGRLLQLTAHKS